MTRQTAFNRPGGLPHLENGTACRQIRPASGGGVTYQEVWAHLGLETQRQWSDRTIARTTPVLMGLFSWITLASHSL